MLKASKQASKLVVSRARGKGEEADRNGVELPLMVMKTVLELDNDDDLQYYECTVADEKSYVYFTRYPKLGRGTQT